MSERVIFFKNMFGVGDESQLGEGVSLMFVNKKFPYEDLFCSWDIGESEQFLDENIRFCLSICVLILRSTTMFSGMSHHRVREVVPQSYHYIIVSRIFSP